MSKDSLGKFNFTLEFTCQFAALSGDFNPLHVDPVVARRYLYGTTVVHGMAVFFQALEFLFSSRTTPAFLADIRAQFFLPIRHNDNVEFFGEQHGNEVRLEIHTNGKKAQALRLLVVDLDNREDWAAISTVANRNCIPLSIEDAMSLSSSVDLVWDPSLFELVFPNIKRILSDPHIASLLAFTKVVGMRCPGLNSVFVGFCASFAPVDRFSEHTLDYHVTKIDERFSLVDMKVGNACCTGEINAIFRPPIVNQESYGNIKKFVGKGIFTDQVALIVGGSRGIGEITSKIICAGGGESLIGFARGKADAESLRDEIQSGGGNCEVFQFDVLRPENSLANFMSNKKVTHLYYFASPRIQKTTSRIIDHRLLETFLNYYVVSFSRLIEDWVCNATIDSRHFKVFVPSSVFLDDPPAGFLEYCIAKKAAEECCLQLHSRKPEWQFFAPRLPMLLTDQTSGISGLNNEAAVSVVLDHLLMIK